MTKTKDTLTDLVAEAKGNRAKNKHILRDCREDPGMASEVKELLCADLNKVYEVPGILGPSAARQRYRELGSYSTSLVDFMFGTWAEFQRQAGISDTLHTRTVKRNISKSARAQDLAHYADEFVKPWDGAYTKLKIGKKPFQMQIGSDFHSHFCNPFALRVWRDVMKAEQPEAVRYNGDLVDFPSLSTHRQFPGHFPMTAQDETDWAANDVMAVDRKNNPKGDHKFLIGNHDVRLMVALADKGPMFACFRDMSFAEVFKLDENEVGLICRSNFLHLSAKQRATDIAQNWETLVRDDGKMLWTTVHGWLGGKDSARKHLARFMTHGSNGHLHDRQLVSAGTYCTGVKDWYQTPAMAYPAAVAAGYIHGPIEYNGWSCGFLVVTIYPDSGHVSGDYAMVGDEIATFRGRVWKIRQHERDTIATMMEI